MIVVHYLRKNILRTFIITFLIMFAIFFAQQLIVAVTEVSRGNIPTQFVIKFIAMNMPAMLQYFLPFSLFLGILISFIRMYHNQEIIAMYSCGVSQRTIFRSILPLTVVIFILLLLNGLWLSPYLLTKSRNQIQYFKTNPTFSLIKPGTFNNIPNTNYIIFVNSIDNNIANNIYLFNYQQDSKIQFIYGAKGVVKVENGDRKIVLYNGYLLSQDISPDYFKNIKDTIPEINLLANAPTATTGNTPANQPGATSVTSSNNSSTKPSADNLSSSTQDKANLTTNTPLNQSTSAGASPESARIEPITPKSTPQGELIFSSQGLDFNSLSKQIPPLGKLGQDLHQISFNEVTITLDLVQQEDNLNAFKYKTLDQLMLNTTNKYAYFELAIRIISALSVFLFSCLSFVFGRVNPRRSRSNNIVMAVVLYLVYLLILNSVRTVISKEQVITNIGNIFILVNVVYLILMYIFMTERPIVRNSRVVSWLRHFFGIM